MIALSSHVRSHVLLDKVPGEVFMRSTPITTRGARPKFERASGSHRRAEEEMAMAAPPCRARLFAWLRELSEDVHRMLDTVPLVLLQSAELPTTEGGRQEAAPRKDTRQDRRLYF